MKDISDDMCVTLGKETLLKGDQANILFNKRFRMEGLTTVVGDEALPVHRNVTHPQPKSVRQEVDVDFNYTN